MATGADRLTNDMMPRMSGADIVAPVLGYFDYLNLATIALVSRAPLRNA
jgi:hypothetical protein